MKLEEYMEKCFPNLSLEPALFYNWEIGLRFELGNPKEENDKLYFQGVYNRAKTLFTALHNENDELFIVAHDYQSICPKWKWKRAKLFTTFLKEKNLKYKIQHQILPFDEEFDEFYKHQFSLKCRVKDVNHRRLISSFFTSNMSWIYFVNITKGTIFHIYDDRGCDLVAVKEESIDGIYHQYNEWILDYDREKIDNVFK